MKIDTSRPWAVESVEGETVFEIFAEQLEGDVGEYSALIPKP
jgi:hypothetical protein